MKSNDLYITFKPETLIIQDQNYITTQKDITELNKKKKRKKKRKERKKQILHNNNYHTEIKRSKQHKI